MKKEEKNVREEKKSDRRLDILVLEKESVWLLSRNTGDPTVGGLRDKKENCSTRRGLRVGTRFWKFRHTHRGRGFSRLGFILCLKTMLMFELNEAVRVRLIGPKSWDRIVIIFGAIFIVHGLCAWTVWAVCVMIYSLNHVVMGMRSRSAEKYGFTK